MFKFMRRFLRANFGGDQFVNDNKPGFGLEQGLITAGLSPPFSAPWPAWGKAR